MINRLFLISDTHFGIRSNSTEWIEIQKQYFYDFFIPLLKKESKPGDILLHLGDVFDSRQSINLYVLNFAIEIFKELSNILPVYIIIGNHDIYNKSSNNINSLKPLSLIKDVYIYEEPEIIYANDKKLLLMPWRTSVDEEIECINNNPADFLFCHTDAQGLKFNRKTEIRDGISLESLKGFKKIYAGHIHYAQKKKNFTMIGCPYQLTRSDINNKKGVYLLDMHTEEEQFFENTVSPKFLRFEFEDLLEIEESKIKKAFNNNFVDIIISQKWILHFPFSSFYEEMEGFRKLELLQTIEDDKNENTEETISNIDIIELSHKMINKTSYSDQIKEKLISTIEKLYKQACTKKKE